MNSLIRRYQKRLFGGSTLEEQGPPKPAASAPVVGPASRPERETSKRLDRIAVLSVRLAAMGPQLAQQAAEIEERATVQARKAGEIAAMMASLADDLERSVAELRSSSGKVEDALATVSRIAEHTRIISINASIEAARAGEQGRAFNVVVEEVQRLADRTGGTTQRIENSIGDMRAGIAKVSGMSGREGSADKEKNGIVEHVNREAHGMAESAETQRKGAGSMCRMSSRMIKLTEDLLLSLGTFRFLAHTQAEREVASALDDLRDAAGSRERSEAVLEQWLHLHPSFELVYLTDGKGRQLVDNICRGDGRIIHDPAGYGRDWSRRPWYLEAVRKEGVCSTDIYRSAATGDFCFTVAAALRDPQGKTIGVLGADVNFQRLLTQ
jgi:methyl-accepting chemotaxis protein